MVQSRAERAGSGLRSTGSGDAPHSDLPWTHDATLSHGERVLLAGDDEIGFLYISDGADEPTPYPAFANAAFIVKAVNSHDALLSVVRQMIKAVDTGNLQMSSPEIGEPENNIPIHPWHDELLHYARQALNNI